MAWFLRNPKLYTQELEAWGNLGFSLVEEYVNEEMRIVFKGVIPYEERKYEFEIFYPAGYPYLAPTVKCTNVDNHKHQTPHLKNICWHEEWQDYGMVNAQDVITQLQKWVKGVNVGFNPEEESDDTIPLLYELSNDAKEAVVITPTEVFEEWEDAEGRFEMRIQNRESIFQAELTKITSLFPKDGKKKIYKSNVEIYPNAPTYKGFCINVDSPPPVFKETDELVEWVNENSNLKGGFKEIATLMSESNPSLGPLVGIRYPYEGSYHMLIVALEHVDNDLEKAVYRVHYGVTFQSQLLSENHLFKRVAHLKPIQERHVVVVGLGAIGSPIALELAKAGVGKMTFFDYDTLHAGNVVRHVANFDYMGMYKAHAMKEICGKYNPYAKIKSYGRFFGNIRDADLADIIQDADMIICCTGHSPTERYVNDVARRFGIPAIYAYASLGALSGRVFLVEKEGACYHCHQYAIGDRTVPALRQPDEEIVFYEASCAGPSFLGSGIDTGSIALQASRLAIQTLLKDHPEAYEPASYNHMVWYAQSGSGKVECLQLHVEEKEVCKFCDVLPDKIIDEYVPEAVELMKVASKWESITSGHDIGSAEEAKAEFDKLEKPLRGQEYLNQEGHYVRLNRVFLNQEGNHPNWDVECETSEGERINVNVDTFFGYEVKKGFVVPSYEKVASNV